MLKCYQANSPPISLWVLATCNHVPAERKPLLQPPLTHCPETRDGLCYQAWCLDSLRYDPEALCFGHLWNTESKGVEMSQRKSGPAAGHPLLLGWRPAGKNPWDAQGSWGRRSQTQTWTLPSSDGRWRFGPELVGITCDEHMGTLKCDEFWEETGTTSHTAAWCWKTNINPPVLPIFKKICSSKTALPWERKIAASGSVTLPRLHCLGTKKQLQLV